MIMFSWLADELYAWMSWLIIPFIVEIIPAIGNFIILIRKTIRCRIYPERELDFLPQISLLIPVYNSAGTLEGCIDSIDKSTYPNELIDVILVNNKSPDNSFEIYVKCQEKYKTLKMQWLNAGQGKSKALNLALFNSEGKYIINIDSDGKLEEHALYNMVRKFENNKDIHCMTGIILTEPPLVEQTKKKALRFLQRIEFLEYGQAFLVGRNYNSEYNTIFTLSGAFSAFRKSTILKTQLYNTNTICEDAHLTMQVKKLLNQAVALCESAIFMVDPIESMEKLYTQRQRWQIGELEVFHMFHGTHNLKYRRFFSDANIRLLCVDHTVAFPRLIWCFALVALGFYKYSMKMIATAMFWIYMMYVLVAFLNWIACICFLWDYEDLRKYYIQKFFYLFALPGYNMITFFIRMAGIVNSITRGSSWKTLTYKEEFRLIKEAIKDDFTLKKEKKEREKMNRRWVRLLILFGFLIVNITCALYFLKRNTENNYSHYAKMQENLLNSIVNTTNKDVNTMAHAISLAKTSGGQAFYLYDKTNGIFTVYQDTQEEVADASLAQVLLDQEQIYTGDPDGKRVMSSRAVELDGREYIVAMGMLTSYIDDDLNTTQYNMFVLMEFTVLYLVVVCISLRAINVDKKHGDELRQLESEFDEYKNKLAAESEREELERITRKRVEGIYPFSFVLKLKERLEKNGITYRMVTFQLDAEQEEQLAKLSERYNAYFGRDEAKYYMIIVMDLEQEEDIVREITGIGGKEFGKPVQV
ncbi:MAG: putative glycosyltransferase, exosortase G system-associated [Lachnospiraceae bacterium]|nr:putative glycosyltransferase, exosortase G system-associated [Lachnospiraceae bacterium]